MFTGIIQGIFKITDIKSRANTRQLFIEFTPELLEGLKTGASVAIDGVCLTVIAIENNIVSFDVIDESLRKTTLGQLQTGDQVNIERSLKYGDEIGGHQVSGHVFGTAIISDIEKSDTSHTLTIQCSAEWMKYILPKGFIALDGASLTVGEVDLKGFFKIHLIPETLRLTRFGSKSTGDVVNLEIDAQTQTTVDTIINMQASQVNQ